MTDEQVELLKKALSLYSFTIDQRRNSNDDVYEGNEFYYMVCALESMTGLNLDY